MEWIKIFRQLALTTQTTQRTQTTQSTQTSFKTEWQEKKSPQTLLFSAELKPRGYYLEPHQAKATELHNTVYYKDREFEHE